MPLRLADLLDRIRPAGAPGALATGIARDELAADEELATLRRVLRSLEAAATEEIARAEREADRVLAEAERVARQRRAELADRVATAEATDVSHERHAADREVARLRRETDEAIAARLSAFEREADRIVGLGVAAVRRSLGLATGPTP